MNKERDTDRILPWEWALLGAVVLALLQSVLLPETMAPGWWSVMFPDLGAALNQAGGAQTAGGGFGESVELRWWLLDALRRIFG